jgi:hypothetical protein
MRDIIKVLCGPVSPHQHMCCEGCDKQGSPYSVKGDSVGRGFNRLCAQPFLHNTSMRITGCNGPRTSWVSTVSGDRMMNGRERQTTRHRGGVQCRLTSRQTSLVPIRHSVAVLKINVSHQIAASCRDNNPACCQIFLSRST